MSISSEMMSYYGDWKDDASTYRANDSASAKPDMTNLGVKLRDIDWDLGNLPRFEKNFYVEHPDVIERSQQHAERWRATKHIHIVGKGIPKV